MKLDVEVGEESLGELERLAKSLGTEPGRLLSILAEVASSYAEDLISMARVLRVRRENKPYSIVEEIFYYGVEAWRGIVDKVLTRLKARGRYELEELDLDPDDPSIEIELIALEGSDLKADKVRINWSIHGVIVEAYYYIGEYYERVPARLRGFDVSYLPDEEALLISYTGDSLSSVPPLHVFDEAAKSIVPLER
ncbi:MAG: hypothetical protein F7C08_03280 [Desulfurococcales archaeon]|nr:hypothetical protein [Desulfurococcales archaeon]MCE4605535.1 hypothetical protein [Desulfurococcales archaeon]